MGAVGYAGYARAADLRNGVMFYSVAGIGAGGADGGRIGFALVRGTPETAHVLLGRDFRCCTARPPARRRRTWLEPGPTG